MKKLQISILSFLMATTFAFSQNLKFPAPSPLQTVTQNVGISTVSIEYSRPSARGRVIFGNDGIIPYGVFWRTGANAPTKITFGADVSVNGTKVVAGSYSLFTYPGESEWTIVLNKNLNVYGDKDRNKAEDAAVLKVVPQKSSAYTEVFTIDFSKLTENDATIDIKWANTIVPLDVKFDYDKELTANIEKTMANDSRPYFRAATYYYENGKDINKAYEWITKAYEQSNYAYYIGIVKAKIQLKMGDKKGARETLAKVRKSGGYVHSVEVTISDLEKQAQ